MVFNVPFKKYYSVLSKYFRPHKNKVLLLGLVMLLRIALTIINPQIIRFYIDTALEGGDVGIEVLVIASLIFIVIGIFEQAFILGGVYLSETLAWDSTNQLRFDLLEHTLDLDMTFHNENKPGEMIERIDGDVETLSTFFSNLSVLVIANIVLIVGVLAVLFFENLIIGIGFTIFTIIALISMYLVSTRARPYWKEARETSSDMYGVIEERISGTEDIKANGATNYAVQIYDKSSKKYFKAYLEANKVQSLTRVVVFMIIGLGTTLVFVLGVPLYNSGDITLGSIFLIHYYMGILFRPIFQLLGHVQQLTTADASLDRVNELLATEKVIENTGTKSVDDVPMSIQFSDVEFSYKENEKVIKGVSFNVDPGRVVGIVGATGSGKTTLTRLIFRLYDIDSGKILINGHDIQDYELDNLRSKIAMVTQNVQLYRASIRDNITFFNPEIEDDEILDLIDDVGLTKWFSRQEDGLDTEILSDNSGLSAGEAQLLAITRVFLRSPNMVILDEASSRLDPSTEKLIDRNIEKLLKGRSGIIIAHRLATLEKVDDILILDKGEVIEYGTRKELVNDPDSKFSELLKTGIEEVLA